MAHDAADQLVLFRYLGGPNAKSAAGSHARGKRKLQAILATFSATVDNVLSAGQFSGETLAMAAQGLRSARFWHYFPLIGSYPISPPVLACRYRLKEMELHRPRQWGACWLAYDLYEQLGLDDFWAEC